jgi:hypothetical protein
MITRTQVAKRGLGFDRTGGTQARRLLLLCIALTVGNLACAPKRLGPTLTSGYFFSILTTTTVLRGESTPLVIRVQDAQGNPVDGIAVEFEVEPDWSQAASVSASPVLTGSAIQVMLAGNDGFATH